MNKKYYFALAATAALFAGCSSEGLVDSESRAFESIDDDAPAKIEIAITDNVEVTTRGTGVVGNVGGTAATQWEGQEFNVLMLEKGTMLGAQTTPGDATTAIIKGAPFTATGTNVIALDNDAVYYPTLKQDGASAGVYDFWAYRLDKSETPTAGTPVFNGYDDANATKITVPFKIDGTQDVMIATTTPSDATYAGNHPELIYSAKSARNGVKPQLAFKHLLTSLTFKVKPKSIDISDQATNPTTSGLWQPGYQITNIQVKSKATGELVVAFTPGNEVADADRIEWAAAQDWANSTTLTTFELQCRKRDVADKAHITMIKIAKDINVNLPYGTPLVDLNGNTQFTFTDLATRDALEVYDSGDLDATTGLPTGNKTTLGAVADYGWILTYNPADNRAVYVTTANAWECDYDLSASATNDLVPFATNNVTPVVLRWDASTPASYTWAAYAGTSAATLNGTVDPTTTTVGTVGDIYENTLSGDKFECTAVTPAVPGANPIVSPVGEPMLVAPSNDAANSGYEVIVSYKYWKKTSASVATLTNGQTQPIKVNNSTLVGGMKQNCAFEAGKNYNVTITLYSDGEVLNGDATSTPWDDGGDLNANDED